MSRRPTDDVAASPTPLGGAASAHSLTDRVYEAIKADILELRLAPGDLVVEPALAARYGVSKTPVREALRWLAQSRLVVVIPRRGYMVKPVGFEDVLEVFELRRLVQPTAFAHAVRRCRSADVERMRAAADACAAVTDWAGEVTAAIEFHRTYLLPSGDTRLARVLRESLDECARFWRLCPATMFDPDTRRDVDLPYVEALHDAARDADAARAHDLSVAYGAQLLERALSVLGPHRP